MAFQLIRIQAPSLMNCAACSNPVTSIPTRRLRAAAAARPPMPAPIIAMDRGLAIDSTSVRYVVAHGKRAPFEPTIKVALILSSRQIDSRLRDQQGPT